MGLGFPRLAELIAAADVFCLTSSREGCPNVVREALACGPPVVATDVGAVRSLVLSGQYGVVIPQAEAPTLSRALEEALNHDWARPAIAAWGGSWSWQNSARLVFDEIQAAVDTA